MTGVQIAKIVFLAIITVCAFASFGCGLVISKRKYKNDNVGRQRKLMRVRAICFLTMLIMLLLIIVIR